MKKISKISTEQTAKMTMKAPKNVSLGCHLDRAHLESPVSCLKPAWIAAFRVTVWLNIGYVTWTAASSILANALSTTCGV
jgi:hypothetical protein